MVKVSVLMPVYNTKEEYLRESIESILNQTFADFELIILDDGSKDDISNIVNSYNDKRIKLYKNDKNLGVSKTRNRLFELSNARYCAFQDSDDIAYPERLLKQVEFLDKNPDISIVGTYLECFPQKKIIELPARPKKLDFLGGCMVSQPSCMIRIEDLKKYNLSFNPNLQTSEDYDLFSRAVKYLSIANLKEPLVKYRINQNSLYHRANKYACKLDKEIKHNLISDMTDDVELQKNIMKVVATRYKKKTGFFENIFSIRNEWYGDEKYKIAVILGIKIKLKKHKER